MIRDTLGTDKVAPLMVANTIFYLIQRLHTDIDELRKRNRELRWQDYRGKHDDLS
jgi:hypothetical protein